MKTFYVRLSAMTYREALIEADTIEKAYEIAHELDEMDSLEETECFDIQILEELTKEQIELYDLPTVKQTNEGYKVKQCKI